MAGATVINFGCRLNSTESDAMRAHALAVGLTDTIIVNTCTVTAEAERQARQAIRKAARENPGVQILVTGCGSEVHKAEFNAMPEVAAIIPNDRKLLRESFLPFAKINEHGVEVKAPSPQQAEMQRAFVQVQNGCDHRCTFCIIPFGRGASRSMSVEDVIGAVRAHVQNGYREVVFTGVDIASYSDADNTGLGGLVRRVLREVQGLPRLRLSSLDPAAIDDDLWLALAEEPRLMPHWHLSLQAGDDMILKRMKRRHLRDDVIKLCTRARRLRPDIVFGADIITGFPTETDAQFENTRAVVESVGITWLHVFPYSARTGTPAARMPQVHGTKREERAAILRALGEKNAISHRSSLIGKHVPVLVEKNGIGCTPQFAKLPIVGRGAVGEIVNARVIRESDGHIAAVVG